MKNKSKTKKNQSRNHNYDTCENCGITNHFTKMIYDRDNIAYCQDCYEGMKNDPYFMGNCRECKNIMREKRLDGNYICDSTRKIIINPDQLACNKFEQKDNKDE